MNNGNRPVQGIDWNHPVDEIDKEVWDRLKANFWVPEKVPLSNDLPAWGRLTPEQKTALKRVFGGLTMLDTLQSEVGAPVMQADAENKHEAAVFANITFMEAIHAQSYSAIFSTFCSSQEIDEIFRWIEHEPLLQNKGQIVRSVYRGNTDFYNDGEAFQKAIKKAVSVLLESFLFYSGFYMPLKFSSEALMTNTADIIRLIMRDEGVHGYYIGYKYQGLRARLNEADRKALDALVFDLAKELLRNEEKYSDKLYQGTPYISKAKSYLRYNYNKAMDNLGYRDKHIDNATPESAILSQMAIDANETHDFFSGSGSSYVVGKVEETNDDDWA